MRIPIAPHAGFHQHVLLSNIFYLCGYQLPLTQVHCHYLLPARYDDMALVEADIEYLKRVSMKFIYLIWDENHENLLS